MYTIINQHFTNHAAFVILLTSIPIFKFHKTGLDKLACLLSQGEKLI